MYPITPEGFCEQFELISRNDPGIPVDHTLAQYNQQKGDAALVYDANVQKFRVCCILTAIVHPGIYHVIGVLLVDETERIPISGFPATLDELIARSSSRWLR